MRYQVVVGNIGAVYNGDSRKEAMIDAANALEEG